MRGGLDDALDKLARRDELRRRASGDTSGPSPAISELVEAIAAVVARHPQLGVTVGAEGAGEPVLLHFFFAEGQVQVSADTAVPTPEAAPAARHADFDIDIDDAVVEESYFAPASPAPSHDDQDRYGPLNYGYAESHAPAETYYPDSDTAERRYGSFDRPPGEPQHYAHESQAAQGVGEDSRDLGARMRDLGMASRGAAPEYPEYPPHPFAATPPPPVPPQAQETTRRIHAESFGNGAGSHIPQQPQPQRGGMPTPLPKPIPLKVERPEETEMAARRLAALLRDDPSLLNQPPPA
ncbi:hypothetical protein [Paractinoplanes durhamensis]|uniref:Uncharacterized protein n=1 Tax=Paractinoplanes durhamensis TaxID=113563 RepID=A0ABQ3Z7Y0_9ACTN|nr:hypothetical protein [Actinoplanes durhamensis]GIE05937.1 hypothetical protein Adu01nite_72870 [Actinoplanes durhamensis]